MLDSQAVQKFEPVSCCCRSGAQQETSLTKNDRQGSPDARGAEEHKDVTSLRSGDAGVEGEEDNAHDRGNANVQGLQAHCI